MPRLVCRRSAEVAAVAVIAIAAPPWQPWDVPAVAALTNQVFR
jgi:hypothetical protein